MVSLKCKPPFGGDSVSSVASFDISLFSSTNGIVGWKPFFTTVEPVVFFSESASG